MLMAIKLIFLTRQRGGISFVYRGSRIMLSIKRHIKIISIIKCDVHQSRISSLINISNNKMMSSMRWK